MGWVGYGWPDCPHHSPPPTHGMIAQTIITAHPWYGIWDGWDHLGWFGQWMGCLALYPRLRRLPPPLEGELTMQAFQVPSPWDGLDTPPWAIPPYVPSSRGGPTAFLIPPPHPKWEGTPSKARLPYPPPPSHTLPFPSPPPIPPSLPLMDGMAMDGWASRRREGGEKGAKRDGRRYEWANRLPSLPWTPPLPSPPSHGMGYGSLPMVRLPGIRDAYPSPLMGYPPPSHPWMGWG